MTIVVGSCGWAYQQPELGSDLILKRFCFAENSGCMKAWGYDLNGVELNIVNTGAVSGPSVNACDGYQMDAEASPRYLKRLGLSR